VNSAGQSYSLKFDNAGCFEAMMNGEQ